MNARLQKQKLVSSSSFFSQKMRISKSEIRPIYSSPPISWERPYIYIVQGRRRTERQRRKREKTLFSQTRYAAVFKSPMQISTEERAILQVGRENNFPKKERRRFPLWRRKISAPPLSPFTAAAKPSGPRTVRVVAILVGGTSLLSLNLLK